MNESVVSSQCIDLGSLGFGLRLHLSAVIEKFKGQRPKAKAQTH